MSVKLKIFLFIWTCLIQPDFTQKINNDLKLESSYDVFLNYGTKKNIKVHNDDLQNTIFKSKVEVLGAIFRENLNAIKTGNSEMDLIFLIDASSSVGEENFRSEIKFVRKMLSDFSVSFDTTRVALVTFSSQNSLVKNVDQITRPNVVHNKCILLNKQLSEIKYTGGGTYTLGAFLVAQRILFRSRKHAKKVIFLITDGYSNGGDPVPIAKELKSEQVTIFTIGIRNGNYKELYEISSQPGQYYSYLLDSYAEFESLARRALHSDLKNGEYETTISKHLCNNLCEKLPNTTSCCDSKAQCTCGLSSGQYSCICDPGYYGSGLINSCHLCPNGTYSDGYNLCRPCPDINHIIITQPALNVSYCQCKRGYTATKDNKCKIIRCPELKPPTHGYFVKKTECSNILHNACGVRCRVGYQLEGDSIRLCQVNASWSGIKPSCKVKTCPPLKVPKNGAMHCVSENNEPVNMTDKDKSSVPLDSQCKFKCKEGYRLVGSKIRYCLPLSKWDGLNTSCKRVKCPRLTKIQFGMYEPKSCSIEKQFFGDNCTITCQDGFKLKGPNSKSCMGKFGHWSNKAETICDDVTPPNLQCPQNVSGTTILGKNYGFVSWTAPNVSDNSGLNVSIWTKPVIKSLDTFKFRVGKTIITYIAIDVFKNKAKCNFSVEISDSQPPIIETCIDPPVFLTTNKEGANITWDEPHIFDNSQKKIHVNFAAITKSYEFGFFPIGLTQVRYTAIDPSNNTNECVLNITVKESKCEPMPDPIFGKTACKDSLDGVKCVITCSEGYAFDIGHEIDLLPAAHITNTTENKTELICHHDDPIWFPIDSSAFPDCSITEVPNEIIQKVGFDVELDSELCKNNASLTELESGISKSLEEHLKKECIGCNVSKVSTQCDEELESSKEEDTNLILGKRRRRDVPIEKALIKRKPKRRRQRINVKFDINGRTTEISKLRHVSLDTFNKIKDRITSVNITVRDNSTTSKKFENARLFLDLKIEEIIAVCANGSLSKKGRCVKCSRGTFHNITRHTCQSCPIGYFNDKFGQMSCQECPVLTSTRRIHSKTSTACKAQCPPGSMARKRTISNTRKLKKKSLSVNNVSLSPFCTSCELHYYQPAYGKTECLPCPANHITLGFGSKWPEDCIPSLVSICQKENKNICNNGTCVLESENAYYSCECTGDYIGSNCETKFDSCGSNPCTNNGKCSSKMVDGLSTYVCECPSGFKGTNCATIDEHCMFKRCQNGGTCTKIDNDEFCLCANKFSGEFCENDIRYCKENICENGGDCVELEDGFECVCRNGYLGRRCDLLPCDYFPCESDNHICLNLIENGAATQNSYRCECPMGYKGSNCSENIDYCEEQPCLNNGTCVDEEFSYRCFCPVLFTGTNCETELNSKYVLQFPKSGTSDFVKVPGPVKDLSQFTLCLWLQTLDTVNYGTMFSYATENYDNTVTVTDYNGVVLYINDEYKVTDIYLNDGRWHFICISWQSSSGSYTIYIDGKLREQGHSLGNGTVIKANGSLILGQEQDTIGGKFSQSESFTGRITNLDVWDTVLNQSQIRKYYRSCDSYLGNLYHWGQFRQYIYGDVKVEKWPFCLKCVNPKPIRNGKIHVDNNVALYSCRAGYSLTYYGKHLYRLARKCDKTATWEGVIEPQCNVMSCNHPGHFANGYIQGESYNYGDIVIYHCRTNFELVGLKVRECLQNGTWSYYAPFCLGVRCPNVEQPGSSYMTVISEQKYEDHTLRNSYDVGTQIEFGCLEGAVLMGENFITCLDNGTWDFAPPLCLEHVSEISTETISVESSTVLKDIVYETTPIIFQNQSGISEERNAGNKSTTTPPTVEEIPDVNVDDLIDISFGFNNDPKPNEGIGDAENITTSTTEMETTTTEETTVKDIVREIQTNLAQFCLGDDLPLMPENGYYAIDKNETTFYKIGAVIEFKCRMGFDYENGERQTTCLENGTWSITNQFCKPIQCKRPPVRKNIRLIREGGTSVTNTAANITYISGNMVRYECIDGYEGFGKDIIRCQANGYWNRLYFRCVPISCGKPNIPASAKVIGRSYLFQDKLRIECPSTVSQTVFNIQCYANRTWIPEITC